MSKIPASGAAVRFEEIIGWPYVSPGTNDSNGIDCSGAWVRAYKAYGKSIYHGSNTIYRKHCSKTGKISCTDDLQVGMAVFKHRADGNEPSKYHSDGIGNLYHIGCVTSVNPLRIVHATPPIAKADTVLGKWSHWGMLSEVEYYTSAEGMEPENKPETPQTQSPGPGETRVIASSLRLRKEPDAGKQNVIASMPQETLVQVLRFQTGADGKPWVYVQWDVKKGLMHRGWCSAEYLERGEVVT